MADLRTRFCGVEIDNPFILGSGPLSYDAEGLIAAQESGFGGVVTKTIKYQPTDNPTPHMAANGANSLLNSEGWADIPAKRWIEEEIPKAKKVVKLLIANVGGTDDEAADIASNVVEAGADMVEIGCGYLDPGNFTERVKKVKSACRVPLIVKVNANWKNTVAVAEKCLLAGADAVTAIDSIGPALRIDLKTGKPLLGGKKGYGWLTGEAILPFSMQIVHEIAQKSEKPIIGLGGIMNANSAAEMLMAGADICGICTLPILRGLGSVEKIKQDLSALLDELGYRSIKEISKKSLGFEVREKNIASNGFWFDAEKCSGCGKCVTVCCYGARRLVGKLMNKVDSVKCRSCGLCLNVCPKAAIGFAEKSTN